MPHPFLGYTFRPREAKNRWGKRFTSFLPAVSSKAAKAITKETRAWRLQKMSDRALVDLAREINPPIRGGMVYYGRYYPTALRCIFRRLKARRVCWAQRKYKRLRTHGRRAWWWLHRVAQGQRELFVHWEHGMLP